MGGSGEAWAVVEDSLFSQRDFLIPAGQYGVALSLPAAHVAEDQLPRLLGEWSPASIVVNLIIGAGIFRVPSVVLAEAGTVGTALLAWGLGGVIALCGALSYRPVPRLHAMDGRPGSGSGCSPIDGNGGSRRWPSPGSSASTPAL